MSQDVEQILKETKNIFKQEAFSTTGSLGASTVFYQAQGVAPRRDPFYWVINANLTITLLNKVSVPFSAVLTQQDKNYSNGLDKFSQPFNQFGLSPRYRWITVHAGYRSIEFSEFSLAGALFLGGAVEVRPERSLVKGSVLYGRFVKAVPKVGVDGLTVSVPAFERWGGGAKVSIGTEKNFGDLIFLKLRDRVGSIAFDTALSVTPQENQIIALLTKQQLFSFLTVGADLSYSMYTRNLYEEVTKIERFTYVNQIYSPRPSSQYNKALQLMAEINSGKVRYGVKYKRIDPDYKTLGSVFLVNDVEELSVNGNFPMLKNKVGLGIAGGLQRNNLDRVQVLTSRRAIGAINLSYAPREGVSLTANYSNFSSNTLPVRDVLADSIRFVQLTQNGSLATTLSFGKNGIGFNLSNTLSYQESQSTQQTPANFLNETCSFTTNFREMGLSISLSAIYNRSYAGSNGINQGYGPNLGLQKSFFRNRIRVSVSSGFQTLLVQQEVLGRNSNLNASVSYTIDKHQSLKADCCYLLKSAMKASVKGFQEIRGGLAYQYNFGFKSRKLIDERQ